MDARVVLPVAVVVPWLLLFFLFLKKKKKKRCGGEIAEGPRHGAFPSATSPPPPLLFNPFFQKDLWRWVAMWQAGNERDKPGIKIK